ncbi:MAG: VWA domain-containing protein [Halopseudomonas sp.]
MNDALANFHFLRPLWLLLLPLVGLLAVWLWRQQHGANQWQSLIRAELLQHLLERQPSRQSRWPLVALLLAWILATLALAGPTWEKLPQPLYNKQDALVLILDLSPSMMARDLKPNRLTHARHRLTDLIKARQEGQTGLVVYAGDAHVLAPISDDRQTLLTLVPSLSPGIMPVRGSQTEAAIGTALALLRDAGHSSGQLILITDGITSTAKLAINQLLRDQPYQLSILGIGSEDGAPIPQRDGSFAKNKQGQIQLAKLESRQLAELAQQHDGIYQNLRYDGGDTAALLNHLEQQARSGLGGDAHQQLLRQFDLWHEAGPWLVLLLLPFAALAHRRGWLLTLLILPQLAAEPAQALEWQDLWQTPDQQAEQRYNQGDHQGAAEHFDDPNWRGSALYRSEQFKQAAEQFALGDSAQSHYNRGNALARGGKLEDALEAFDQALQHDPEFDDALFNQQLVQKLLEQQQQNQQQDSDGESSDDSQPDSESDSESNSESDSESQPNQDQDPSQQSDSSNSDSSQDNGSPSDSNSSGSQQNQNQQNRNQQSQNQQQQNPQNASPNDNDQPQQSDASPQPDKVSPNEDSNAQQSQPSSPSQANGEDEQQQADNSAAAGEQTDSPSDDPRLEKWLRQLPEDPSGLLRRKFEYQYQQKLEAYRQGQWQPPEESRW